MEGGIGEFCVDDEKRPRQSRTPKLSFVEAQEGIGGSDYIVLVAVEEGAVLLEELLDAGGLAAHALFDCAIWVISVGCGYLHVPSLDRPLRIHSF